MLIQNVCNVSGLLRGEQGEDTEIPGTSAIDVDEDQIGDIVCFDLETTVKGMYFVSQYTLND